MRSLWLHPSHRWDNRSSLLSVVAFDPISSLCWKLGFGLPHCLTQGRFLSALPVNLFAPKLVATQLTCSLRDKSWVSFVIITTTNIYFVCPSLLVLLNSCFVSTHQTIALFFFPWPRTNYVWNVAWPWIGIWGEVESLLVGIWLGFSRKQELIFYSFEKHFFSSFWFLVEFKKCLRFCPLNNLPKSLGRISLVDGEKWFEGSLLY